MVATGPARYFFLRRIRGAHEEVSHWPPEIKPLQLPDNQVAVAVLLYPEEDGWRAEMVKDEAALNGDLGGAFVLTRDTTIGATPDDRRVVADLALMGVRVALEGEKGPEYATHLVVRVLDGGAGAPKRPVVVPIERLVLGQYVERGKRSVATVQLNLQLTGAELAQMPAYMPDALIERYVHQTLDDTVPSQRARHEIKPEVRAGRVNLYTDNRFPLELVTTGDIAKAAIEHAPGVVEISDHMIYSELLQRQVSEALAAKGLGDVSVLSEHGLIVLSGVVKDNATRHQAHDIALKVTGVKGVVNDLEIQPSPAVPPTEEPEEAEMRSQVHSS
ncbi:MAG TPA: BON domain-containing protein [Ktedonobacterales bacterium]|nr:BON domain-containing protein [Ktedonobacterales bacterium]